MWGVNRTQSGFIFISALCFLLTMTILALSALQINILETRLASVHSRSFQAKVKALNRLVSYEQLLSRKTKPATGHRPYIQLQKVDSCPAILDPRVCARSKHKIYRITATASIQHITRTVQSDFLWAPASD